MCGRIVPTLILEATPAVFEGLPSPDDQPTPAFIGKCRFGEASQLLKANI